VKIARGEGSESVNCAETFTQGLSQEAAPAYYDIHISIVANPSDKECAGVVAEMIPHHRPAGWTPDVLNKVASAKLPVQVTGQLMFDSSHTPCTSASLLKNAISSDPSRISTWEVHPIYRLQVCPTGDCKSGGWVDLVDWKP